MANPTKAPFYTNTADNCLLKVVWDGNQKPQSPWRQVRSVDIVAETYKRVIHIRSVSNEPLGGFVQLLQFQSRLFQKNAADSNSVFSFLPLLLDQRALSAFLANPTLPTAISVNARWVNPSINESVETLFTKLSEADSADVTSFELSESDTTEYFCFEPEALKTIRVSLQHFQSVQNGVAQNTPTILDGDDSIPGKLYAQKTHLPVNVFLPETVEPGKAYKLTISYNEQGEPIATLEETPELLV